MLQYIYMAKRREARISWEIEEYNHREKNPDWFWALGVVAIAGAAIAFVYNDGLFGVLIILSAIILGYYAYREPDLIEISINEEGILVRSYLYTFTTIKGFAIDEHELGNHLLIETSRGFTPIISIALPESLDTDGLYDLLIEKIPEKPLKESNTHRILEHLGF